MPKITIPVVLICPECQNKNVFNRKSLYNNVRKFGKWNCKCKSCFAKYEITKDTTKRNSYTVIKRTYNNTKPVKKEKGYVCNIPDLSTIKKITGFRGCLINSPVFL